MKVGQRVKFREDAETDGQPITGISGTIIRVSPDSDFTYRVLLDGTLYTAYPSGYGAYPYELDTL